MNKFGLVILVILAIMVSGCSSQPSEPSLIYNEEGCTYSGPTRLEKSFNINWTVEETFPLTAILQIVSIDEGKNLADLENLPAVDPPPAWVQKLMYDMATRAGSSVATFDLGPNASFKGGSIYIVCFSSSKENALGAVGPIQIAP